MAEKLQAKVELDTALDKSSILADESCHNNTAYPKGQPCLVNLLKLDTTEYLKIYD